MSGRKFRPATITTWSRGRGESAIRGPIRVVHPVLRQVGVNYEWDSRAGYYVVACCDTDRVLVALERQGHVIDPLQAGLW